ncbi:MAG: ACT domain-containing protein [Candidatus Omnitrophica bacterium]|nr:ACT domain-containing protein [Candidatus Omnitrophota bacterium]
MENRPGVLAKVCSILSEAGISILALAIHDTVDNAVVRLLVDSPTKALLLMEEEEFYVLEQTVVVLEILNRPGELTHIAQTLAQADINIAYAYCTARPDQHSGCLVLKTDNPERTLEVLTR